MVEPVCVLSVVWSKWYFDNYCNRVYYEGRNGSHYAEAILSLAKTTLATSKQFIITPAFALEPSFEPTVVTDDGADCDGYKMTLDVVNAFAPHKTHVQNVVLEKDRALFKTPHSTICIEMEDVLKEPLTDLYGRFFKFYRKEDIHRTMRINSDYPEWEEIRRELIDKKRINAEQTSAWLGQIEGDSQEHKEKNGIQGQ